MQFNTGDNSIVKDVRWWCRLSSDDTENYPIADIARNANMGLDRTTSLIQRSDNAWEWDDANNTDLPIATANLVASQEDYSLAVTHLKILRVRAKDENGNWLTLNPVSRRQISDDALASTGTPTSYDKLGNSIFLSPKPSYGSSAGLEIQFQRGASYFESNDTAKEPGFASQFHRLVSLYAALDYCDIHLPDQAKVIRARIEALEAELIEFYSDRDRDGAPRIELEETIENF